MVRQCCVCKIYTRQREAEGLSFHGMPKEPTRRSIWVSLLGFEKDHQFPKYAYVCSKHFQKSDFVIMPDGARHLKCDAVPTAVHSAFDLTKSSESSLSLSSFSSPGKEQIGVSSSSEPHSEIDILGITTTSADGGPVVKRLRFEDIVADVKSDTATESKEQLQIQEKHR
ncbi:unnamed protein product [Acanthoscelides obtectus]|uniref:THAP-type domain-containing protein n=2 Tax=Acanthoscelides obtectus TaxID=200917 RepID=A0A9P0NWF9_ACAOB|nr:unnamed protein product [Acanthoscelides obtectus]CAK1663738.1 hypothetical protein AOBTE_LOCUS23831 [Acanthoscelides obtectus]